MKITTEVTPSLQSETDINSWRATAFHHGVDNPPRHLSATSVFLYRTLARRDAKHYAFPTRDADGNVVAVALWHLNKRAAEKEALLTERLELDVASVRALGVQCVNTIEAAEAAALEADARISALPPADYTPRAGETKTAEHIVRSRRDRDRRNTVDSLQARARQASADAELAAALLVCVDEALQQRWELHLANVTSWRRHRDRLGHVITRAAVRRHPDPTEAAVLIREALALDPTLSARHPWAASTTLRKEA